MRKLQQILGLIGVFLMMTGSLFSQDKNSSSLFNSNAVFSAEQTESIANSVSQGILLRINENELAEMIKNKSPRLELQIPFTDGRSRVLNLERFDILTPTAQTTATNASGLRNFEMSENFVSYRGTMEGATQSFVSISFSSIGVIAVIDLVYDKFIIASLENSEGFKKGDYIIYKESRIKKQRDFFCASDIMDATIDVKTLVMSANPNEISIESSDLLICEVALECDFETYTQFGSSVENATAYMLSVMSSVSALYIRDLNVKIVIPFTHVWEDQNDPYTGTSSFELIDEFRSYWLANFSGVTRDLAHYLSTRPGGLGGVAASIGGLCQTANNAYAFSNINGSFAPLPLYSWDVDVLAHETGHNFGSFHTHSCVWNPRIDTCVVTGENDPCSQDPSAIQGSIMSYCHLTSFGKTLNFHLQPIAAMRAYAEGSSCISTAQTALDLVKPNGGEQFSILDPLAIIWGSSSTGFVDVYFSPDSGATWELIGDDIPVEDRNFSWEIPAIPSTQTALLRIENAADPNEFDIVEGAFSIEARLFGMSLLEPAHLETINVAPDDTTAVNFLWTNSGTLAGINYKADITLIGSGFPSTQFVSNNDGQDTSLTLMASQIDSFLTEWNAWGSNDSVRVRWQSKSFYEGDSVTSPFFFLYFKKVVTGISEPLAGAVPKTYKLQQNYPNPFNPETTIRYALPVQSEVVLEVFDITGRLIQTIVNENQVAGTYQVKWRGENNNGQGVSSGVYIYRLRAGKNVFTKKMLLIQ